MNSTEMKIIINMIPSNTRLGWRVFSQSNLIGKIAKIQNIGNKKYRYLVSSSGYEYA